jgi:hypothetical protein
MLKPLSFQSAIGVNYNLHGKNEKNWQGLMMLQLIRMNSDLFISANYVLMLFAINHVVNPTCFELL